MTGAGVTSAPLMPAGFLTAAPSHSRCTYVWLLLLPTPPPTFQGLMLFTFQPRLCLASVAKIQNKVPEVLGQLPFFFDEAEGFD